MKLKLNKLTIKNDTGKFWSLKDTKSHKRLNVNELNKKITRFFIFEKSYLLRVKSSDLSDLEDSYVIPLRFVSPSKWPSGFYEGIGFSNTNRINNSFSDEDILEVIIKD